jgi:glycosyltransferase involved in cell wall biosynthesis
VSQVPELPRKDAEQTGRRSGATTPEPSGAPAPPRISIVVPCYNGARHLAASLGRLFEFVETARSELGSIEVIVVDDGSSDATSTIVASQFPGARLVRHAVNRGKGAAVRTGMQAAAGDFLFFIDADVPYDLSALAVMLDYLDRKEFHLCIGTRPRASSSAVDPRGRIRRIASWLFTEFVSRIVVTGIRDTQSGFKGFRREPARFLFEQSRIDNFAFDVELLYLAFKNDLDVKRVPVRLRFDDYSSVSLLRHVPPMVLELLKLPFRFHLGRYETFVRWQARRSP